MFMPTHDQHDRTSGGRLTIDLAAIRHNYRALAARAAPAAAGAVVKADAYGLGAARIAPVLYEEGCRQFFVAHLREAIDLRPVLAPDAVIHVLNGLSPGAEPLAAIAGVRPVLNSLDQIELWSALAAKRGERLAAALQIDTGMSRLGLSPAEVDALLSRPALLDRIEVTLVMSHLACADDPEDPANGAQLDCFRALAARLPEAALSFANSGGVLLGPEFRFDVARLGVALYGVDPIPGKDAGLRPACQLQAKVVQLRDIPAGTGVGYGLVHRSDRPARLATLAVGYADGLPRRLGGRGSAWFNGVRLPIVGRVSMDSMTLDVTALDDGALRPGDSVEIVGPQQSPAQIAADADTIPWEILTSLGHRYSRVYVDGDRVESVMGAA